MLKVPVPLLNAYDSFILFPINVLLYLAVWLNKPYIEL